MSSPEKKRLFSQSNGYQAITSNPQEEVNNSPSKTSFEHKHEEYNDFSHLPEQLVSIPLLLPHSGGSSKGGGGNSEASYKSSRSGESKKSDGAHHGLNNSLLLNVNPEPLLSSMYGSVVYIPFETPNHVIEEAVGASCLNGDLTQIMPLSTGGTEDDLTSGGNHSVKSGSMSGSGNESDDNSGSGGMGCLSLEDVALLPEFPAPGSALAILPRLPSVQEEEVFIDNDTNNDFTPNSLFSNLSFQGFQLSRTNTYESNPDDTMVTIVPQPEPLSFIPENESRDGYGGSDFSGQEQGKEGYGGNVGTQEEELMLMPRPLESHEEVVFLPRMPKPNEQVIFLPKTPSMMDYEPPVYPVEELSFWWRLKSGLIRCLSDGYFIASFTYVLYTIQALIMDYCEDVALFENQCDETVLNYQYVFLAALHVLNAVQYLSAWMPWLSMNQHADWSLKCIFIFPEVLNLIEGMLYLDSALGYQAISDSHRCQNDARCPKSLRMHYVETAAASVECLASCFWFYAWYYIFMVEHEGLRKRDKLKYALFDPEFYSVIFLVMASILYIWYYKQVDIHPRKYDRDVLFEEGDWIYLAGSFCYMISSMKICGVFFFIDLPGWDEGKEAQPLYEEYTESEGDEDGDHGTTVVKKQLFSDVEMANLEDRPKPTALAQPPAKQELIFTRNSVQQPIKIKKKKVSGIEESSVVNPLISSTS